MAILPSVSLWNKNIFPIKQLLTRIFFLIKFRSIFSLSCCWQILCDDLSLEGFARSNINPVLFSWNSLELQIFSIHNIFFQSNGHLCSYHLLRILSSNYYQREYPSKIQKQFKQFFFRVRFKQNILWRFFYKVSDVSLTS